ncbi:MAG TPA: flagellar hook-associated protein 3 [Clostridiaceae bacterium]|nr:flagellar hook-associated protein 3 [Clostridiaceae bacterium]HBF77380.1 flagellar hook-associated protein 3 [Clostridiaceae bacterium]HBG39541.1 flagellar hook-associated protein 3 [Clostridiaceae bacterium]HBN27687.1 flagellar hook-associated protein 3 [Clostridiaceae bacterium]HBX49019.1 flagellar hook-associated protein 3 [Clostridiaceae bacterium]
MGNLRITNKILANGYLTDLNRNLENMSKLQEQMSSGKEICRPSDDPFKVARTMELTEDISINERYAKNIDEGIGWLNSVESSMGLMTEALQTIREKTVAGGNDPNSATERKAISDEIKALKDTIVNLGNTVFDGRYIFGGDKTTEPPFTIEAGKVVYKGSPNGIIRELAPGVRIDIGVIGNNFMGVFETIDKITDDLDHDKSSSEYLGELDTNMDNVMRMRSEEGAKWQRLNDMKKKNGEENFNMTELLSKTSDIDVAEKYMNFKMAESVYIASLESASKILQPSLLDFLR